jgi:hypothetical protein
MSEKIMQENLENCLQISEQELESVVGGALVPARGRKGRFSGLPLPRTGGIAPAAEGAATVAVILGTLAI